MTRGRGGSQYPQKWWRHLWTAPNHKQLSASKYKFQLLNIDQASALIIRPSFSMNISIESVFICQGHIIQVSITSVCSIHFNIVGPGTLNIKCFFVFQGGWKIQNLWNSGFCFCGFLRWLTNTPLGRHFLPSAWDIIYTPCFASSWFSYNTLPYFLSFIDLISLLQEVTPLYSEIIKE